jgi:hypothetical protein
MNKLIVTIFAVGGLLASGSVMADAELYNTYVKPGIDAKKQELAVYKPPLAFLQRNISDDTGSSSSGQSSSGQDSSGPSFGITFPGQDFGITYPDEPASEDGSWQ